MNSKKKKFRKILPELDDENIHHPTCPCCGSNDVYGISRVVGYWSVIDNWNKSKKAELKQRQKGNYWHDEG